MANWKLGAVFGELDPFTGVLGLQVTKAVVATWNNVTRACDVVTVKGMVKCVVKPELLGGVQILVQESQRMMWPLWMCSRYTK